jgi:tetratricopeptide (TPR) repeat protein
MRLLITVLLLATNFFLFSESGEQYLADAIAAYEQKDYQAALNNFSVLENSGLVNADLFYNIGNCHFRLQNLGFSILYYMRALKIQPNHQPARINLQYAQTFTTDKLEYESEDAVRNFWKTLFDSISLNFLAWLMFAFCFAIIVLICLVLLRYRRRDKTAITFAIIIFTLIFLLLALLSHLKWREYNASNQAVLISISAVGYSGPSEDFTRVFTIHEGIIFQVERTENEWSLIKLPNGLGGWIKKENYEII